MSLGIASTATVKSKSNPRRLVIVGGFVLGNWSGRVIILDDWRLCRAGLAFAFGVKLFDQIKPPASAAIG